MLVPPDNMALLGRPRRYETTNFNVRKSGRQRGLWSRRRDQQVTDWRSRWRRSVTCIYDRGRLHHHLHLPVTLPPRCGRSTACLAFLVGRSTTEGLRGDVGRSVRQIKRVNDGLESLLIYTHAHTHTHSLTHFDIRYTLPLTNISRLYIGFVFVVVSRVHLYTKR